MTDPSIAIRNVYVMLAYASQAIHAEGTERIEAEGFDHLQDLLAEILVRGVGTQVKRGFHRDYLQRNGELTTVRGRIDIGRTVSAHSTAKGRLVCDFDEYDLDTAHNQALKSVMVLLVRQGDITSSRKAALRRLIPHLDAVTLVPPTTIRWSTLAYHRANATYRLLLGVCELIVRGLLPTQDAGTARLRSWVSDVAMSRLYERFVREYFKVHHPALAPAASAVAWDYDAASAIGAAQLPAMQSDVTLRRGERVLIVDAKFYGKSMQTGRWNKGTVHSANLYQVLAYVKNEDVAQDGSVSGLLLYARTDAADQPDLDVVVQRNRIGARTLDLNQPWENLRAQLEDVVTWLDV